MTIHRPTGTPPIKKKRCKASYTVYCQYYSAGKGSNVYLTGDGVRLPKVGVVRARLYRKPLHWWKLKAATVSRTLTGKYFCSLMFEYEVRPPKAAEPTQETTLGLNYSLSHFYVDSNGYAPDPPRWMERSAAKLTKLQRRLARMQLGSRNYEEQLQKIRTLHEHIANQRRDFIHKESRRIANAWDAVCVKDTDMIEMSRILRLGKVMDSGFGYFRTCLRYKLERQGKPLIVVDKYFHLPGSSTPAAMSTRNWSPPSGAGPVRSAARSSTGAATGRKTSGTRVWRGFAKIVSWICQLDCFGFLPAMPAGTPVNAHDRRGALTRLKGSSFDAVSVPPTEEWEEERATPAGRAGRVRSLVTGCPRVFSISFGFIRPTGR